MLAGGVTTCMFWRALSVNLRLDGGSKDGNRDTEIVSLLQVRKVAWTSVLVAEVKRGQISDVYIYMYLCVC